MEFRDIRMTIQVDKQASNGSVHAMFRLREPVFWLDGKIGEGLAPDTVLLGSPKSLKGNGEARG